MRKLSKEEFFNSNKYAGTGAHILDILALLRDNITPSNLLLKMNEFLQQYPNASFSTELDPNDYLVIYLIEYTTKTDSELEIEYQNHLRDYKKYKDLQKSQRIAKETQERAMYEKLKEKYGSES